MLEEIRMQTFRFDKLKGVGGRVFHLVGGYQSAAVPIALCGYRPKNLWRVRRGDDTTPACGRCADALFVLGQPMQTRKVATEARQTARVEGE